METNKKTCFFYLKTNGCRHGTDCTKIHPNASRSKVAVIKNMYLYPKNDPASTLNDISIQIHLDLFYEDWFIEISLKYGPIRRLVIALNNCAHLLGNIYIEFEEEHNASICVSEVRKRSYSGKRITAELGNCCRVENSICKSYEKNCCLRGGLCSLVHPAKVSEDLVYELFISQKLFCAKMNDKYRHDPNHSLHPQEAQSPNIKRMRHEPHPLDHKDDRRDTIL